MEKKFDLFEPIFVSIPDEPIYEGELYGMDHESAKKAANYYRFCVYTLLDKRDDNAIISTGLIWEEVIALVDHLGLDDDEWDVIEHEVEL